MTLADQAAMTGQDGRVTQQQPDRPKRRTFTKAYKARILAAYNALPEGSPERGALLRSERLYHSHIEHWRKQAENGTLGASAGKPKRNAEDEETTALRAEIKKLKADAAKLESRNEKLAGELNKTKSALDITGKAFALLQDISSSADSDEN
jgi:transposase-like protein